MYTETMFVCKKGNSQRGGKFNRRKLRSRAQLLLPNFRRVLSSPSQRHYRTFSNRIIISPYSPLFRPFFRKIVLSRIASARVLNLSSLHSLLASPPGSTILAKRDAFSSSVETKTKMNSNPPSSASRIWFVRSFSPRQSDGVRFQAQGSPHSTSPLLLPSTRSV